MKSARILCVDDEPNVLEGLERVLHRKCFLLTASSGAEALKLLAKPEPIDVIVSDMRMPGTNGATLLAEYRKRSPDTARILLTGHADLADAIRIVNEGQVFRFLSKPCPAQQLIEAIEGALEQSRLSIQERSLLEQSVVATVRALIEVIALVHPGTLGSASRMLERTRKVTAYLGVCDAWHVEVAAILAQAGYVVLPNDLLAKVTSGAGAKSEAVAKSGGEVMLAHVPLVLARVLAGIPRFDLAQAALKYQQRPFESPEPGPQRDELPIGSRILKALADLTLEESSAANTLAALNVLRSRQASYDPVVLHAIASVCAPQTSTRQGGHGAGV